MAANFLHGAETIEVKDGPRTIRLVKSSVIGIVGTAPIFAVAPADRTINVPMPILSDLDGARMFGSHLPGFTIPAALNAITDHATRSGSPSSLVVNVFDPARHKTAVPAASYTFDSSGVITLPHMGVISASVRPQAGGTDLVPATDYVLDQMAGTITRVPAGAISAAATVTIAYERADVSKVTASDIIGGVDAAGRRTGLQAFRDSYMLYGYWPKILIAPGWSSHAAVDAEMTALAEPLRAMALRDAPVGATVPQVLAGRGPMGSIAFDTSSPRALLCYPHLKVLDPTTNEVDLQPLSVRAAAVMGATDMDEGYWVSPSNHELKGIVGVERPITAMINDASCEANALNEAGIVTVFNSWGSGIRLWGNRSAAWPAETHPENFIAIRRTLDVIHESVELAMLQFMDGPLNPARIDSILASVNGLVRKLIGDGALVDGRYWFVPGNNPVEELANGHLVLNNDLTPPPPLERITFKSRYSIQGLRKLYGE
jgi:uncharacterized protein